MFNGILSTIRTACLSLIFFTVLTGLLYPGIITLISQVFFHWEANGSLIKFNDQIIGSLLIGQSFQDPKYFWGRPSATFNFPYDSRYSSGSNLGPSNLVLLKKIQERAFFLKQYNPKNKNLIPVELVTSSASGLDPEISPLAAYYQIDRIANARKISSVEIIQLMKNLTIKRSLGIWGEPRFNVMQLNLALDHLSYQRAY